MLEMKYVKVKKTLEIDFGNGGGFSAEFNWVNIPYSDAVGIEKLEVEMLGKLTKWGDALARTMEGGDDRLDCTDQFLEG